MICEVEGYWHGTGKRCVAVLKWGSIFPHIPHIPQPMQLAFQVYRLVLYLLYRKVLRLLTLARFFKVLNTVLYATFNTCAVSLTPELFNIDNFFFYIWLACFVNLIEWNALFHVHGRALFYYRNDIELG